MARRTSTIRDEAISTVWCGYEYGGFDILDRPLATSLVPRRRASPRLTVPIYSAYNHTQVAHLVLEKFLPIIWQKTLPIKGQLLPIGNEEGFHIASLLTAPCP